jgi:hypothetical protein
MKSTAKSASLDIQEFNMIRHLTAFVFSIFLCGVLGFPRVVGAEDANNTKDSSFHEAMVEFLTIQDAAQVINDQMTFGIAQQTLGSIAASGVEITDPMQTIVVDAARETVGSKIGDVEYLAELYAPLYSEIYSESELRELIAFWQSPLGKKTIDTMPRLTEGSQQVLQEASAQFVPDFEATIAKKFEDAGIIFGP